MKLWERRERQEVELRGARLTPWERALDDATYDHVATAASLDCFACQHLRTGDACVLMATAGAAVVVDVAEYRASNDPHTLCPHFVLATELELEQRKRGHP